MGNWTASAWPILASAALKSTLVLGAAWLIAWLLRGRSAAARHMVWTASAAALVALPMLSVALPALHIPWANAVLPADAGIVFHATAGTAAEMASWVPTPKASTGAPEETSSRMAYSSRSPLSMILASGNPAWSRMPRASRERLWKSPLSSRMPHNGWPRAATFLTPSIVL